MIYMVDHIFANPATESAWHEWYTGYLQKLLSVPGFGSAQRFRAIGETPSRYLAMYSVASAAVYDSEAYRNIGGGGSQSARFHTDYRLWTRNLFKGADTAPVVNNGQCVYAFDSISPDRTPRLQQTPQWLKSVGLHQSTPYRAIIVLDAKAVDAAKTATGGEGYFYAPYTPRLSPQ